MDTKSTPHSPGEGRRSEKAGALPALVSLHASISNGALRGESLPTRIKLLNWGENPSIKGTVRVGQQSLESLAANQRARGFERVALDYNHCSVPGTEEYEKLLKAGQPPIIFGYGRPNIVSGDGLYLEEVQWTPLGADKARNFEDLSPAVPQAALDAGELDFVHSVALTTNGCLHDVTFFSAKVATEKDHMSDKDKTAGATGTLTLAVLSSALGLAATATEADVTAKINRLVALEPLSALIKEGKVLIVEDLAGLSARVKTLEDAGTKAIATLSATGADGKTVTLSAQDLVGLAGRVNTLETSLKQLSEAGTASERGKLIALFSADGKAPINPATGKAFTTEELQKQDVSTLKLLHANTPVTVPLSARGRAVREGSAASNLKGRARFVAAQEAENAGHK